MNSDTIEQEAVLKVKSSILKVKTLSPSINERDKEPVWDGQIYLYKNEKHSNKSLYGAVNVQVKGKTTSKIFKERIKYSVDVTSLKIFKNNLGVLFFVVYLKGEDFSESKIYYKALTPVFIDSILKDSEKQKTKQIEFDSFPSNKNEIAYVIHNFHEDSIKQASIKHTPPLKLKEVFENTCFDSIQTTKRIFSTNKEDINIKDILLKSPLQFYARLADSKHLLPIESVEKLTLISSFQIPVLLNGVEEFDYVQIEESHDNISYVFGKSVTLKFYKQSGRCLFTYKQSNSLRSRIKDLGFLIEVLEKKSISLSGGKNIPVDYNEKEMGIDIKSEKNHFQYLLKIQKFLDNLEVEEDLILDGVEKNSSFKELDLLINSIDKDRAITFKISKPIKDKIFLLKKEISNLILLLYVKLDNLGNSTYLAYNYFNYSFLVSAEINGKNNRQLVTRYDALSAEDYQFLSNINFSKIPSTYINLNIDFESKFTIATKSLLNMLSAYDKTKEKKNRLIDTAMIISKWLVDNIEVLSKQENYIIAQINYLQVIKRVRILYEEEKEILYDILDNNSCTVAMKAGAYILLDNINNSTYYLNKLSSEDRKEFKDFPIYTFYKDKEKKAK